jgi:HK97 family phage prohead protease
VDHTELVNKQFEVTIEKATSADYDARFVMSATSPDRVKDTIDESAYKPNLGKKIIALWQHNSDQPFGYWHNLRVESGKLIGDLKAAGTNLGLMIKQLLADGVPLGASIGFRGKGEENKQGGIHFKQIELLECSVVSVPAHPLAYQIAKSFGIEMDAKPDGQNDKPVEDLAAVKQRAAAALQSSLKTLHKDK